MKNKVIVGALAAIMTTTAMAGVKDKKAIRNADKIISEQVAKTKAACGNATFDVSVKWDDFKKMAKLNQDKMKSKSYQSQWVMSHAGDRTVSTLEALSEICSSDADYKEEIALLTKVVITPKANFDDSKTEFSLEGTVLKATSGHRMTRRASDFIKPIKSLY